jgi:hypothetical protein
MVPPLLNQQIRDGWWKTDHIDEIRIEVGEPRSIFASESNLIDPAHQLPSFGSITNMEAYLALPSPAKSRPTG